MGALLASANLDVDDVFDFTNSPAIFYYLLPYEPPTRFPHVSLAIRDDSQEDLISDLEDKSPKVVVFDTDRLGQPAWDGVANEVRHDDISAWVLDRYQPWASLHGYTFMQRNDLSLALPEDFGPEPDRQIKAAGLLFNSRPCAWGGVAVIPRLARSRRTGSSARR